MIGESGDELQEVFGEVTLAGISVTRYRPPFETNIFVCRQPKFMPEEAEIGIKMFR